MVSAWGERLIRHGLGRGEIGAGCCLLVMPRRFLHILFLVSNGRSLRVEGQDRVNGPRACVCVGVAVCVGMFACVCDSHFMMKEGKDRRQASSVRDWRLGCCGCCCCGCC